TATGKTVGTANAQAAGVAFNPTVRMVDRYFNVVNVQPSGLSINGTDPHDSRPGEYQADPFGIPQGQISSGTFISTWTFTTANNPGWTLTAAGPGVTDTTPNIQVNPGSPRTLQVVLPGETAVPGLGTYSLNGTGRTGTAQAWVSGVSSQAVV